jgi:predicted cupin superfamily sugar epimerase
MTKPVHNPDAPLSDYARRTIASLGLEPHPEGGWFHRDWQAGDSASATPERPLTSLIYFLLPAGDFSEWHKVDADEIWLWHGPAPVRIGLGGSGEAPILESVTSLAGSGSESGVAADTHRVTYLTRPGHMVVPAGVWQRTIPTDADVLVSCVVSPGFVFSGFTLE